MTLPTSHEYLPIQTIAVNAPVAQCLPFKSHPDETAGRRAQ